MCSNIWPDRTKIMHFVGRPKPTSRPVQEQKSNQPTIDCAAIHNEMTIDHVLPSEGSPLPPSANITIRKKKTT